MFQLLGFHQDSVPTTSCVVPSMQIGCQLYFPLRLNDIEVTLNFAYSCVFSERPFEMFLQYSRNGIVIGSIDDVMSGFHSLIGSINQNELPTPPSTGERQQY